MGCLKCGLLKAVIDKMDAEGLIDNMADFSQCVTLDEDAEQAVVDNAQTKVTSVYHQYIILINYIP